MTAATASADPHALTGLPIYDEDAVVARMPPNALKRVLAEAFRDLADGEAVQPPTQKAIFPGDRGDVLIYGGVLARKDIFGVKVSPYLPLRAAAGKPTVTAYTIVFSMVSGQPLALCDALSLTTERTAATTSLALDYLVPPNAQKLAVIGSGSIARAHLRYELSLRSWRSVCMFSPSLVEASDCRAALLAAHPIEIADTIEIAVRDADVVMLCTSSGEPVIDMRWLKDEVTVTSISTNAPNAREIEPAALGDCHVFCDYRATAPAIAGDMVIAARDHQWDPATIVADLPALVSGRASELPRGRRYFRSVGLGLEDVAAAALVTGAGSQSKDGPTETDRNRAGHGTAR